MANAIRQVQELLERKTAAMLDDIRAEVERRRHPFRETQSASRRYPAEVEGKYLVEYLNALPASKNSPLLDSLGVLQALAQAGKRRDVAAIDRLRTTKKGLKFAYGYLFKRAMPSSSVKEWMLDVHEDGVIVHPTTAEGKAALAVLVLETKGRLERMKRCLHCRAWFYARFKHQQFCADSPKRCQWNHYHSPEWRKTNRERNKKHQRAYRERLFGKTKTKSVEAH